jgi:hypothetical protein
VIEGTSFWQMHLVKPEIPESVQVTAVQRSDAAPMRLRAEANERLQGVALDTDDVMAEHAGLVGAKIRVTVQGLPYEIIVKQVVSSEQPFWTETPETLEVYDLWYRSLDSEQLLPLCPAGGPAPSVSLAAIGGAPSGWLSIACAASL